MFLPKVASVKKRKGVKAVSLQPLFPGYLFINLAITNDNLIQQIKQNIEGNDNKSLDDLLIYQQGEKVQVTQGPFTDLEAIYKTKDGIERCVILINMLGQENEVAVDNQEIEKVA